MLGDVLTALADQPWLLAAMLFAATFLLEDAATIAAGVLVAQTGVDPLPVILAVIAGTAAGDLALYGLGRWGAASGIGIGLRSRPDVRRAEQWIAGRALTMAFAARFIPGLRLPVYTACGLVAAPTTGFVLVIVLITPFWTIGLFAIAWLVGEAGAQNFLATMVPVGAMLLVGLLIIRRVKAALTRIPAA